MTTFDAHYFRAIADRVLDRRNKRTAVEAEGLRLVRRQVLAANAAALPRDLQKLARHLRVADIRYLPLAMGGRIVVENDAVVVEISPSLPEFGKRLTLAHELAHLILERDRIAAWAHEGRRSPRQNLQQHYLVESLCDSAAEEILLPAQWLREQVISEVPTLSLAVRLAGDANCELDWVLMRIIRLGFWRCRLLWFSKSATRFRVTNTFPEVDEGFISSMEVGPEADELLIRCATNSTVTNGELNLRVRGDSYAFPAEFIPLNEQGVLSLVRF